jgi:ABC-type dipeptide/oligopeptide/nickel transport system permease subunit
MSEKQDSIAVISEAPPRSSEFRRVVRLFLKRRVVIFSFIIMVIFVIAAIFAPLLAPYNPYKQNLRIALKPPSTEHLLGTDTLGRDFLSRIIYGARTALMVGLVATVIAASVGMVMGLVAGYFGRWVHSLIMRIVDALMAFPFIIVALLLAVLLGGGLRNVMIAVGIGLSAQYARVMCGLTLSTKQYDYITASRSIGATHFRTMLRHILPNCLPSLIVLITINMGAAIMIEASLSYLGVGIETPGAAWGAMVTEGYRYLLTQPWIALIPGVAIMLVVYSFNMVGDGLRDALDPRLRGLM